MPNKINIPTNDLFIQKLEETKTQLLKMKNKSYVIPKVNSLPTIDGTTYAVGSKVHLNLDDNVYIVNSSNEWELYIFKTSLQEKLVSGQNIKTFNGVELLGDGDITLEDAGIAAYIETIINVAKSEVKNEILDSAPEELNTLKELADALKNNKDSINNILNQIGSKASQSDLDTAELNISNLDSKVSDLEASLGDIDTLLDSINGEVV